VAEEYGVLYSFGAAGGGNDDGSTTVGGIGIVTDPADERRLATLALDAASTSRGGGGEGGIAVGSSLVEGSPAGIRDTGCVCPEDRRLSRIADAHRYRVRSAPPGRSRMNDLRWTRTTRDILQSDDVGEDRAGSDRGINP
jgi:hypothetical protein